MQDAVRRGEALDVSTFQREGPYYVLPIFLEGNDYCDAQKEKWIWSIGRRLSDGKILASTSSDLYQNPDFECLFLR
jgi:hypothetical protein